MKSNIRAISNLQRELDFLFNNQQQASHEY